MKKTAIDLLWLRPGKVGGTEVYIRNLLDGLCQLPDDFNFVLLVSKDNEVTFRKYLEDKRFSFLIADTVSANIGGRIIWQYFHQNALLRKNGISTCFVPVYVRPFFNGGIHYINVIHDIQAYHYPQYHPFHENFYSYVTWFADAVFSRDIVAISDFVKRDIVKNYHFKENRITVIPNPVTVNPDETVSFEEIAGKYGISAGQYYYTLSQNIPHKNFKTLVKVMAKIKSEGDLPQKLLVSGISGNASDEVQKIVDEMDLKDNIIHTGFVSDAEKNTLIKNAKAFLFPSFFEGFGIPPVEAMILGQRVITTTAASIPEVTLGMAEYVEDYMNPDAWISAMKKDAPKAPDKEAFNIYKKEEIAKRYLHYLQKVIEE
ncbi:glycosyltransferase family 4 protein [Butyrivibrio sp. NC2002]|uniref:glycosyltransferase family 4 protein n=1 Tax=Butyrivibrio sp. NC2002 TaxID=1410610 RepID=UPI0005663508|nr:glycosyltransferase family 1 protein [Butyrivibrio sp. NC2002]